MNEMANKIDVFLAIVGWCNSEKFLHSLIYLRACFASNNLFGPAKFALLCGFGRILHEQIHLFQYLFCVSRINQLDSQLVAFACLSHLAQFKKSVSNVEHFRENPNRRYGSCVWSSLVKLATEALKCQVLNGQHNLRVFPG